MMKAFTLFFAILIFSISFNSKLSANPPDSCLWAPDYWLDGIFYDHDAYNKSPTIVLDTCGLYDINPQFYWYDPSDPYDPFFNPDSPEGYYMDTPNSNYFSEYIAINRLYSKSIFGLYIEWSVFDTAGKDLNALHYFTVDDIDETNQEVYNAFQQVKQIYGNIKFWFHFNKQLSISEVWNGNYNYDTKFKASIGEYAYIETEDFVCINEFVDLINSLLPDINCEYRTNLKIPTSVIENTPKVLIKLSSDYNTLTIDSEEIINSANIYTVSGANIKELSNLNNDNKFLQIDVSTLYSGIYFVKINNLINKFIIVR